MNRGTWYTYCDFLSLLNDTFLRLIPVDTCGHCPFILTVEYPIKHINQLTYPWYSKMKNGSFPFFQNQKLGSPTILSHATWRPCAHTPIRNTGKILFPHVLILDVTTLIFFAVMWYLNIWFCIYLINSRVDPGVDSLLKWPQWPQLQLFMPCMTLSWVWAGPSDWPASNKEITTKVTGRHSETRL